MYKIGVIGDRDSVLGFKALGLNVFFEQQPDRASKLIHQLARDDYAIIFITEPVAMGAQEAIARYKTSPFPAIIPIPNNRGSLGLGLAGVKANVEKAIGSDIIFNNQ